MPPRCSLPPLARTRRAWRNRPRRAKSSQIGISSASNIASKSVARSAAIRRTIAVVSIVSAAATLAFRSMRRRCQRDYLSPNQSPTKRAYRFLGMAPPWTQTSRGNARLTQKPTVLSDFILESEDGVVNVVGIILGLSAATRDVRIILVATLAALGAESIAMGAVAYTSTRARRRLYLSQAVQERREVEGNPPTERDEGREDLPGGGCPGGGLHEIVERICRNPTAELEFMMSFELKLSPVEASAPRASAFLVGSATVVGHFIPLSPFFFIGSNVLLGAVRAVALSAIALLRIGWDQAKS